MLLSALLITGALYGREYDISQLKNIEVMETLSSAVSQFGDRKLPVYSVQTTEKNIALSFDCAWGAEDFDSMMETKQETLHHMYTVGEHTIHAMMNVRNDKILRLTMLLHDTGKPEYKTMDEDGVAHFKMHALGSERIAKEVLRRLKFDNDTLHKVTRLVLNHDYRMPAVPKNVRRAMNKIGEDIFPYYMEVRRADVLAQSEYQRAEKLKNLDEVEQTYAEIIEKGQCVSLKELAVTGRDLIRAGMKPGKEIGEKLNELLNLVIENPEMNTKEILLKYSFPDKEV